MLVPIFATCKASPAVTALLGVTPMRLYEFGEAPPQVAKPYAVWQEVSGLPENYINDRPNIEYKRIQIDCYADSSSAARNVQSAIERAIELSAHVVSYNGEFTDPETKNKRSSFDVAWWVTR